MENNDVRELVERLGSDEDGVRKMAAFKLQTSIADPSFADVFTNEGGITKLRWLILNTSGNTLAYSLTAFSKLLEVDMGWSYVDRTMVERIVQLVVTHPLVNILRGAMSILVAVVSHSHTSPEAKSAMLEQSGFQALKPAISSYPQFLETLVNKLSSADYALCTNALQLVNALMRDSISNGPERDWPKFIKRLQELGVIRNVYTLMQGSALQDLAVPLLEFQSLTKILIQKWALVSVDMEKVEHRKCARDIYQASYSDAAYQEQHGEDEDFGSIHPNWPRLGFQSSTIADDFTEVGFLGMMDLSDYVRKDIDAFQKNLLEQSTQAEERRCPISRCSIAVSGILYDHFEIDKASFEDNREYFILDSQAHFDKAFQPFLLQWSKLHAAGLQAFLRLWKATGAAKRDFGKVAELARILLESVVERSHRTRDIHSIEEEIQNFSYKRLRELQMEISERAYENSCTHYLRQVREELNHEAMQFIKEQRIKSLLDGSWFPMLKSSSVIPGANVVEADYECGYVKLSHNRKFLHFAGFDKRPMDTPLLEDLPSTIDLTTVSSVVSNVNSAARASLDSNDSSVDVPSLTQLELRICINGTTTVTPSGHARPSSKQANMGVQGDEFPLLVLHPETRILAAEWLDGLLMILRQPPITAETERLLDLVSGWGLKIRLLNVNFEKDNFEHDKGIVPSRDGLDEDYHYDIAGGV